MSEVQPRFGDDGLITAVVQDANTSEVLMVAHMNREAWEATLRTRRATFFSRSRQTLWEKGETSGNTMHLRAVRIDCDGDAVLLQVHPDGPACHTGERTCFFTGVDDVSMGAAVNTKVD
ncbi:MAG: phosphoribosyl-AMP cyclohydrolase [Candidatus Dormiibacterota bacterium]